MKPLQRLLEFDVLIGSIVTIVIAGWMSTNDPDFYWHLKNGELIIANQALFNQEPFSHTANGTPIQVTGWFFDVLLAYIWDHFGAAGIRILSGFFVGLLWLGVYRASRLYIDRRESSALIALFAIVLLAPTLAVRPNIFTHCAFAWVLYCLLRFIKDGSLKNLIFLIPLFVIWPNFHYGFAAAITLILLFICCAIFDRVWPLSDERPLDVLLKPAPIIVFVMCLLAVGANPSGLQIYPELVKMTVHAGSSSIEEWASPDFKSHAQKIVLLSLMIYLGSLFLTRRRFSWLQLFVPASLLWAYFSAVRNVAFWAVVFPVFLSMSLMDFTAQRSYKLKLSIGKSVRQEMSGNITRLLNAAIMVFVALFVYFYSPTMAAKLAKHANIIIPVAATDHLLENIPDGRLYNRYGSGGYLIWRGHPRFPVFVDGRYAPYSDDTMKTALHIQNGFPGSLDLMAKHRVEIALIGTNTALAEQLYVSDKYRIVYTDEDYSIYVVDTEKFATLKSVDKPPYTLVLE